MSTTRAAALHGARGAFEHVGSFVDAHPLNVDKHQSGFLFSAELVECVQEAASYVGLLGLALR